MSDKVEVSWYIHTQNNPEIGVASIISTDIHIQLSLTQS